MSHDRTIILGKINLMKGNATTGDLTNLATAVVAGDDKILNSSEDLPELHEKLEEVQEWLVDDSTSSSGAADQVETFVTELNALI